MNILWPVWVGIFLRLDEYLGFMPESPDGYTPYRESTFPPNSIEYLAHGAAVPLTIATVFWYGFDAPIALFTAAIFGIIANLFLHESIHYVTQSRLGYDPVFEFPNRVWSPNEAFTTREDVISLLSPQILTVIYIALLPLSESTVIDFMLVIAAIANLLGGLRDIAWAMRRVLWPEGHLVFVDSDGKTFVAFASDRRPPEGE